RLADRDEVSVAAEPHVDALGCVPELDERRIEIEVNANRDAGGQVFVREHAGDVYQHVSPAADGSEFVVRKADGLPAASQQKRGGLLKAEFRDDLPEVRPVLRQFERGAGGLKRRLLNWLDEIDVVAQPAEAEDVLQHGPGGPTLVWVA